MKDFFESIKIRTTIFVWIISTAIVMAVSEMKYFKGKTVFDQYFWLTIANSIVLIWFVYKMWRNNISISKTIIEYKDKFDLKESIKILSINIALVIGLAGTIISIIYAINPEFLTSLFMDGESNGSIISLAFNFTGTVILAPCIEELMFRGVLLNRLAMKYSISKAVIISSILFGIFHVDFAAIGAIFFGIMMCIVYIKTENILITISIHAMNNFIMWLINLIPQGGTQECFSKYEAMGTFIFGIIFFVASIFFAFKYMKNNWPSSTNVKNVIGNK